MSRVHYQTGWGFSAWRKQLDAKERAHEALDRLWQGPKGSRYSGSLWRDTCYRWLAAQMGRPDAHIGQMGAEECGAGDRAVPCGHPRRHRRVGCAAGEVNANPGVCIVIERGPLSITPPPAIVTAAPFEHQYEDGLTLDQMDEVMDREMRSDPFWSPYHSGPKYDTAKSIVARWFAQQPPKTPPAPEPTATAKPQQRGLLARVLRRGRQKSSTGVGT